MVQSAAKLEVGQFLDLIASDEALPGAGAGTAVAAGTAAALAAMTARQSAVAVGQSASNTAEGLDELRYQLLLLADHAIEAQKDLRYAYALPADCDAESRHDQITEARARAVEAPRRIAELAAEVSAQTAKVVAEGHTRVPGEAVSAVLLAAAAAGSAAGLVNVHVRKAGLDEALLAEVAEYLAAASAAVRKVGARPPLRLGECADLAE